MMMIMTIITMDLRESHCRYYESIF